MAGHPEWKPQRLAPYLSPDQQDLLVAALNSQATTANTQSSSDDDSAAVRSSSPSLVVGSKSEDNAMADSNDSGLYLSPTQADLDGLNADFTPDLDYLDGDSFDFDNADLGGDMIGALPGSGSDAIGADQHEKRKNTEDSADGDAKRQETQEGEKSAKKPGRKPLTSEPTTKRKAQNRAAQRAFRERKEKHLKDLETKVNELTKADEVKSHENGILKAQVDRLQVELREYRKRLSLNSGSTRGSPPMTAYGTANRSNSISSSLANANDFNFDFPKFGNLPGSQILGNSSISASPTGDASKRNSIALSNTGSPANSLSGVTSQAGTDTKRSGSIGRSSSPQTISTTPSTAESPTKTANLNPAFTSYSSQNNMHGFANTLPQMEAGASVDPFGDLFSPSILKSVGMNNNGQYFGSSTDANTNVNMHSNENTVTYGGDSTSGLNRVFQFNGGHNSNSTSPSATSSNWNANANSSCGTSPEPCHDSPANKDKSLDTFSSAANNPNMMQAPNQMFNSLSNFFNSTDYNVPSTENFDPLLFGDYRDSNDAIVGGGDFTGGFFDDALNQAPFDLGSPSNLFGILQSPSQTNNTLAPPATAAKAPSPSKSLMASIDKTRDGGDDDYGLPGTQTSKPASNQKLISCSNIWNQLQANPDFQDGKFDLEGLCSELRSKARCSETGVLVDQDHVDAALRKLGKDEKANDKGLKLNKLMFEQASWDNVLRKMNNTSS